MSGRRHQLGLSRLAFARDAGCDAEAVRRVCAISASTNMLAGLKSL